MCTRRKIVYSSVEVDDRLKRGGNYIWGKIKFIIRFFEIELWLSIVVNFFGVSKDTRSKKDRKNDNY